MEMALRIAEANTDYPKFRLAAVIVKGGSLLSVGWSKLHTDPALVDQHKHRFCRVATHAEVHAINMCKNPAGATLYVARVNRNDQVGMSKPCKKCMQAIQEAGIRKVFYTTNDGEVEMLRKQEIK